MQSKPEELSTAALSVKHMMDQGQTAQMAWESHFEHTLQRCKVMEEIIFKGWKQEEHFDL